MAQPTSHSTCGSKTARAELRPAADLWGKDVFSVQELLKERHGEAAQVICIGPAGEHRVVSATIHHRQKNCAGMAGFGAVMGAKNLKAIVIRGTGAVQIADRSGSSKRASASTGSSTQGPRRPPCA